MFEGFCSVEVFPSPKAQLYVAPPTPAVVKGVAVPKQTGLVLDGDGVAGVAFTIAATVPVGETHPLTVTLKLYVPVAVT